jgi:hypothetical protein
MNVKGTHQPIKGEKEEGKMEKKRKHLQYQSRESFTRDD